MLTVVCPWCRHVGGSSSILSRPADRLHHVGSSQPSRPSLLSGKSMLIVVVIIVVDSLFEWHNKGSSIHWLGVKLVDEGKMKIVSNFQRVFSIFHCLMWSGDRKSIWNVNVPWQLSWEIVFWNSVWREPVEQSATLGSPGKWPLN